jgi:hypothetical protein
MWRSKLRFFVRVFREDVRLGSRGGHLRSSGPDADPIRARSFVALEKTRGLRDDAIEESVCPTLIGGDKTFTGR